MRVYLLKRVATSAGTDLARVNNGSSTVHERIDYGSKLDRERFTDDRQNLRQNLGQISAQKSTQSQSCIRVLGIECAIAVGIYIP